MPHLLKRSRNNFNNYKSISLIKKVLFSLSYSWHQDEEIKNNYLKFWNYHISAIKISVLIVFYSLCEQHANWKMSYEFSKRIKHSFSKLIIHLSCTQPLTAKVLDAGIINCLEWRIRNFNILISKLKQSSMSLDYV